MDSHTQEAPSSRIQITTDAPSRNINVCLESSCRESREHPSQAPGVGETLPPGPISFERVQAFLSQHIRGECLRLDAETGCYIWTRAQAHAGYPSARIDGRTRPVHRVVFEHFTRPLNEGEALDHLCRTPSCVRPDHTEPITRGQNCRRGLNARLTYGDVEQIRTLREEGHLLREIAERFGTTVSNVSHILRGSRWNVTSHADAYGEGWS